MSKQKFDWISEADAAKQLGYKEKVLRRYCTEGRPQVDGIVWVKVNYKTYEYCQNSIDEFKAQRSSAIAT